MVVVQEVSHTSHNSSSFSKDLGRLVLVLKAIKDPGGISIMQDLETGNLSPDEIVKRLTARGVKLSASSLPDYVGPLLSADLVELCRGKCRLTVTGSTVVEAVGKRGAPSGFPVNSNCYEEVVLLALKSGYRTYHDLAALVKESVLSRILSRLRKGGLIQTNRPPETVFFRVTKRLYGGATPTQRRVFQVIQPEGTSIRQAAKTLGISVRRTYKHVAILKKRRFIFQREIPVTYQLTCAGSVIADFVEEVARASLTRSPISWIVRGLSGEDSEDVSPLRIVQQAGQQGILQSELWKRMGVDSRKGSRTILSLERKTLLYRKKELNRGRWTFRVFSSQKPTKVDSIVNVPCASCEDDPRGNCPTDQLNPETCARLEHWVNDTDTCGKS